MKIIEQKQVKNISGETIVLVGVGICDDGKTILVPNDFNNANFVDVKSNTNKVSEIKDGHFTRKEKQKK